MKKNGDGRKIAHRYRFSITVSSRNQALDVILLSDYLLARSTPPASAKTSNTLVATKHRRAYFGSRFLASLPCMYCIPAVMLSSMMTKIKAIVVPFGLLGSAVADDVVTREVLDQKGPDHRDNDEEADKPETTFLQQRGRKPNDRSERKAECDDRNEHDYSFELGPGWAGLGSAIANERANESCAD